MGALDALNLAMPMLVDRFFQPAISRFLGIVRTFGLVAHSRSSGKLSMSGFIIKRISLMTLHTSFPLTEVKVLHPVFEMVTLEHDV